MLATSTLNTLPKLELAAILMYLMILPNVRAALDHTFFQHQQTFFQQNDIRRLLGDIHGGIDRDADVGVAQGRRVVDAVPEEADDVAICVAGCE